MSARRTHGGDVKDSKASKEEEDGAQGTEAVAMAEAKDTSGSGVKIGHEVDDDAAGVTFSG
jgi:hypothetical protein